VVEEEAVFLEEVVEEVFFTLESLRPKHARAEGEGLWEGTGKKQEQLEVRANREDGSEESGERDVVFLGRESGGRLCAEQR